MVLKELILTLSTFGGCGGLERTDFKFLLWEGVVVLKELNFNTFLLWESLVVLKELILTLSTLEGCGGLQ